MPSFSAQALRLNGLSTLIPKAWASSSSYALIPAEISHNSCCTDACKGQRHEEQDDAFAGEIPEAYVLHSRILERERGCVVSYLNRHLLTPHRLGKAATDFGPVDDVSPSCRYSRAGGFDS